jgi:hypothetical protein
LKKNDLIDELDSRHIDVYNLNKTDLLSKLPEILHGIQRPAALICLSLFNDDTLSTLATSDNFGQCSASGRYGII